MKIHITEQGIQNFTAEQARDFCLKSKGWKLIESPCIKEWRQYKMWPCENRGRDQLKVVASSSENPMPLTIDGAANELLPFDYFSCRWRESDNFECCVEIGLEVFVTHGEDEITARWRMAALILNKEEEKKAPINESHKIDPARICKVIEMMVINDADGDPEHELQSDIYMFAHLANWSCTQNHPEWLDKFLQTEKEIKERHAAPNSKLR